MTRPIHIDQGLILIDGALEPASITLCDGAIAELGQPCPNGALRLDASGLMVLPGMVDVHSDAFERQIMPRPGVHFDIPIALVDTDRQLAANGITTCYHGLTLSWEPGLRSLEAGRAFMAGLKEARAGLGVDHRVQIRWETFLLEAIEPVAQRLGEDPGPVLAFNDHTTLTAQKLSSGHHSKLNEWAERAGLSAEGYVALFNDIWSRRGEVPHAIAELAGRARAAGAVMLSHDDRLRDERVYFRALGADIAEFPMSREVVEEARASGEHTVLGAPNVVRGGSHNGALSATAMIGEGLCTILASDYYYPAMAHAASRLAGEHGWAIEEIWPLVSQAPAEAMRLADRGRIEAGLRGDVVLAGMEAGRFLAIEATIAGGRLVHLASHDRIAA